MRHSGANNGRDLLARCWSNDSQGIDPLVPEEKVVAIVSAIALRSQDCILAYDPDRLVEKC